MIWTKILSKYINVWNDHDSRKASLWKIYIYLQVNSVEDLSKSAKTDISNLRAGLTGLTSNLFNADGGDNEKINQVWSFKINKIDSNYFDLKIDTEFKFRMKFKHEVYPLGYIRLSKG